MSSWNHKPWAFHRHANAHDQLVQLLLIQNKKKYENMNELWRYCFQKFKRGKKRQQIEEKRTPSMSNPWIVCSLIAHNRFVQSAVRASNISHTKSAQSSILLPNKSQSTFIKCEMFVLFFCQSNWLTYRWNHRLLENIVWYFGVVYRWLVFVCIRDPGVALNSVDR